MPKTSRDPKLPGTYVREAALKSNKISVSQAAKILGIGRPALSNFLNGNASISPDMAARIERAFGISAEILFKMQAAYDAAESKAKGAPSGTKAYVPPFLAIKANEIEDWAATSISARTRLPVFLRTLINSTGVGLSKVDFPGNDDGERRGKDGVTVALEGTPWVPKGKSHWEFGCNKRPKTKADQDYANKTRDHSSEERKETEFIFVTPRRWSGKQDWEDAHRKKGQWKDVRVLDASNLEQWLEQSIAAQAWFAAETLCPSNGAYPLDKCWKDWADVTNPPLPSSLFAAAIEVGADIVASRLTKPPESPTIIAADSKEEGLAYLAQLFNEAGGDLAKFRDRIVVFQESGVLPKLAAGTTSFIAVAATRDVEIELAPYCQSIHTIVVHPRNVANAEPHVVLEPLHDTAFRKSLEELEYTRDDIDKLGRESGRSLTVLRRRLAKVPIVRTPQWAAQTDTAQQLAPFLFAGAWTSINTSDQAVVSLLSGGVDYPTLEKRLQALTGINDAPTWSIDKYRGIVSKIDLLFAIGVVMTESDLNNYFEVAHLVLSEDDPSLDLPEKDRWAANIYGKTRETSSALRDGISETLVLLAVHGNTLFQERLGIDVEALAAQLVRKLLTPLTTRTLEAQERDLPTYAEAAPSEFLSIVEEDLKSSEPASLALMRPVESDMFGGCVRSGLLWALEGLAWPSSMLARSATILGRLAQIQIDDNWANKPIESLRAIFRSWMPQTEASLEQRIAVIKRLVEEVPAIAWQVCVDQFGDLHQVGHYSHKPRWRNDGHGFGEPLQDDEIHAFRLAMIEMSLSWTAHNCDTLGDLIERLYGLNEDQRATVWKLVKSWAESGASDKEKVWVSEKIRVTVLSKPEVGGLAAFAKTACKALEPTDTVWKHEWLFRQDSVDESADELHNEDTDFHARDERIAQQRKEALQEILADSGVDGVLELAELGKAPGRIGGTMAIVLAEDRIASFVLNAMPAGSESWTRNNLVYGMLHALSDDLRAQVLKTISSSLNSSNFSEILRFAPFVGATWVLVDKLDSTSQDSYWANVSPDWRHQSDVDLNDGVERLLAAKRPRAAFSWVHFMLENIRPALVFRLLSEIATGNDEPPEHYKLDGYYIAEAFKILDDSGEFTTDQLTGLEFSYVEALSRKHGTHGKRGVPSLELYIDDHPEFFAEVISWVFKRGDDGGDSKEMNVDPKLVKSRAERGYRLLGALERIPGRNKQGDIDADRFLKWLMEVRRSCDALGRQVPGDLMLGQLIAKAPADADGVWPCEPVRDGLERINSRDIARGIRTGLYNLRGFHARGPGGDQEKNIAAKYRRWTASLEFSHPYVAAILRSMAESYDDDGRYHDTEAKIERRLR